MKRILVTGATGYVGGRLIPELLNQGHAVRVLVRDSSKVQGHAWADQVEVIIGDANNESDLIRATENQQVVYYLLHSLHSGAGFQQLEQQMAEKFARACTLNSVEKIIYLGGISNDASLSKHLSSRVEVGKTLASSGIPVFELRAGMIIGSGSASFEMLRHLTHRLPIMTTPKWIKNRTHPIAIRDVLYYLSELANVDNHVGGVFDIGGPTVLSYADLMHLFAEKSGLRKRIIISIPVLTPRLASLWIGLVTPLPTSLAKNLVQSLIAEVVADPAKSISQVVPEPPAGLLPVSQAIELALARVDEGRVDTRWSDARLPIDPSVQSATDPTWVGARTFTDYREARSTKPALNIWRQIERIGGNTGWYGADLLWRARGLIDSLVGGVGLRRGRRDPELLRCGESLDFWRVEALERGSYLRLRAEMKLPGEATLEFSVVPLADGTTRVSQTANFVPRGLFGYLYWYAVLPFHFFVFPTMIRNIIKSAND
uniref:ADP-L-glycero-D-manno-heptose-6-epimerase n=1 Tax=uncultured Actinomycetes bacterium TaxID=152507 RepID=A0A871Y7D1_9ACTN|nr:SDR family oxidoreductase [uncultured Actinomycetes bacterium]QOV09086.1 ADP-L-glycero-D-manno-heptose-6-epimerase [uncultured Actinomycetes bacterium]